MGEDIKKTIPLLSGNLLFLAVEIFIVLFVHDPFVRPYIGDVLAVYTKIKKPI